MLTNVQPRIIVNIKPTDEVRCPKCRTKQAEEIGSWVVFKCRTCKTWLRFILSA